MHAGTPKEPCYPAFEMLPGRENACCRSVRFVFRWPFQGRLRRSVCAHLGVVIPVFSLFALFARFFPSFTFEGKIFFGIDQFGWPPVRVSRKRQNPDKTSVLARLAAALVPAVLARGAGRKLRLSKVLRGLLEKSLTRSRN